MQMSVPEVMDLGKEHSHSQTRRRPSPSQRQNLQPILADSKGDDPTFANNCLLARRLVENGVRFVQLYDWGWDHHGSSPGESIDETLPIKCRQIDRYRGSHH